MREIKFRGKCIKSGKWLYGDLHHDNTRTNSVSIRYKLRGHYCNPIEVDPSTVGQYTGLKDKDGKEIWEGDVLEGISSGMFSDGEVKRYQVIWGLDSWHIKDTHFSLQELFDYCNNRLNVVYNIHENG